MRHKQIVKLGICGVGVDHGVDQGAHEAFERYGGVLNERGFDHAVDLLDVALMERGEYGSLVGEVLIERADAYTGDFSNVVGRYGLSPLSLEDADNSFENGFDSMTGAELLWPAPMN